MPFSSKLFQVSLYLIIVDYLKFKLDWTSCDCLPSQVIFTRGCVVVGEFRPEQPSAKPPPAPTLVDVLTRAASGLEPRRSPESGCLAAEQLSTNAGEGPAAGQLHASKGEPPCFARTLT